MEEEEIPRNVTRSGKKKKKKNRQNHQDESGQSPSLNDVDGDSASPINSGPLLLVDTYTGEKSASQLTGTETNDSSDIPVAKSPESECDVKRIDDASSKVKVKAMPSNGAGDASKVFGEKVQLNPSNSRRKKKNKKKTPVERGSLLSNMNFSDKKRSDTKAAKRENASTTEPEKR